MIWVSMIVMHTKGFAFYAIPSGMSIVFVYCVLYIKHILRIFDEANLYALCNELALLLLEGILVGGMLKVVELAWRERMIMR